MALPFPLALAPDSPGTARGARVCIIGGGGTGAALSYDLALRGLSVNLLEKGELTSGTTGRHHGQLHCGARYALADREIARECMAESLVLREIVSEAIEYNGGIFVALDEEDEALTPVFVEACRSSLIPAQPITVKTALELESALNPGILAAVRVPDGSFDAWRLALSFFAAASALGATIRPWCEVVGFELGSGRARAAVYIDRSGGEPVERRIEADYFVSATGAWAGRVGALAGLDVPVTPAPGTMVAVAARLTDHVISHLHRAGDGDIIVPQRRLSIIGSTERIVDDPEALLPEEADIARLIGYAEAMLPAFGKASFHAAWCAARPLAGRPAAHAGGQAHPGSRSISRDFTVVENGLEGFCTLVGGKATVLRAMAEKAADLVCLRLGIDAACRTREFMLPSWRGFYTGRK